MRAAYLIFVVPWLAVLTIIWIDCLQLSRSDILRMILRIPTAITKNAIEIAAILLAIAAVRFIFRSWSISLASESKASLWVHESEWLLFGASILLAIGLVGEWPDADSWKKTRWYKAGKFAVIIGVLGELAGDAGVFRAGDRLQELEDKKVVTATEQATKAHIRALEAAIRAGEAQIKALRLEESLITILSPRHLSDAAIDRIVAKIKHFGPQPFDFAIPPNMEEGSDFHIQVLSLLTKNCEWILKPTAENNMHVFGAPEFTVSFSQGLVISYDKDNPKFKEVALVFADAFGDEGIATKALPNENPNVRNVLHVAVGTKPIFLREVQKYIDVRPCSVCRRPSEFLPETDSDP